MRDGQKIHKERGCFHSDICSRLYRDNFVTAENYVVMSYRGDLDSDDFVTGSSNFGNFIKLFESDDSSWIEEINDYIE